MADTKSPRYKWQSRHAADTSPLRALPGSDRNGDHTLGPGSVTG